jgi:signal transduction histidine kinase
MSIKQWFFDINQKINNHAIKFPNPYLTFALFGIITYPFYYFLWRQAASGGYENLNLRLVTVFLCILLALNQYWPKKYKLFLPLYWYTTLLYSLPFLFTFLLLKNNMSYTWSMNTMTVLVLSILLIDLSALLIILGLGISLGILLFILDRGKFQLPPDYSTILITYSSVLFFGAIFSFRKDQLKERQRRIAAETANLAKSALISNMGHDLKTPFIGIEGNVEILRDHYAEEDPELKDFWDQTFASIREIRTIIDAIIDVIAMERPSVNVESFSVNQVLESILVLLLPTAHSKKLELMIHKLGKNKSDIIETDKLRFKLILNILISNAIKFTDKGRVTVSVLKIGDYFHIKVADTGIGIPPEQFAYIFEPFTKLSLSNKNNSFQGVGGGLYSAQIKAEELGAVIEVESEPGKGSIFTLIITVRPSKK